MSKLELHWNPDFSAEYGRNIVDLINATVADGGTLGFIEPLDADKARQFLSALIQKIAKGETYALYGSENGEPVFFVLMNLSTMPNCRHSAELAKGVVSPRFRGQGLVQAAFKALISKARALQIEQFVLDVRANSRAHQVWQYFGFKTWGVLEDYARINGQKHAGHYMAQSVESLAERIAYTQEESAC
ncbi:GNAT family N-acetyltransferase [Iodobacter sp. LRB]|uniref:GNAT family N-acetyltransferase n=1 Tax=unclassified Iodobacter TaxID=235634 RepID=UPI000C0FF267|nr:GNAT family N-acetyltransferase [Iodobacter sp. BJB302]PHV01432.1 GNAT family N-acetyltransferase [Iodobacter sp. BJB302]